MTVSVWQELATPPTKVSHDVAIVGAGMVGSHIAGLLTQAGRDVALVEARHPAAGASGRNGGLVLLGMRDRYSEAIERFGHDVAHEVWSATAENLRRMRELVKRFNVEHQETGAAYPATDAGEAKILRESATALQRDGFGTEFTDQDTFDSDFAGVMFQPGDFTIQPAKLNWGLAEASGAVLYENNEVFDIRRDGAAMVVRSRQNVVRCGKVVLAVNGYAGLVHPFFQPLVEPVRGQVLATEPLPRMSNPVGLVHNLYYYQQLSDGRLVIGGGRQRHPDEERTYSDEINMRVQAVIDEYIAQYFPEAKGKVSRRWAGISSMTADGLPIIGHLPDEPEVYFAVGFSSMGNSMGLVAGERLVELMLNDRNPGVFSVQRFS